jgi:mono/diheme cytochrome c family protein
VLKRVDSVLAVLSWLAAGVLVLMLFIGPQGIAEDKSKPTGPAAGSAPSRSGSGGSPRSEGKGVFADNCGSCHTLEAAGTSGQVGPRLDGTVLRATEIEKIVRTGRGPMPSFDGRLSDEQISAVAAFVAGQR